MVQCIDINYRRKSILSKKRRHSNSRQFRINIGTVIFGVIFIYLLVHVMMSLNVERLSVYEVQNSYIDTNINTTALIIRDEILVNTDSSGYVSYYVRDGEKIGKDKTVYTIDETGSVYDKLKDLDPDKLIMSNDALTEVRTRISTYENYFDYSDFSELYNFKYDIENAVLELTNEALIEQLTDLDDTSTNVSTYKKIQTNDAGIITYYKDGYEKFNLKNFKASDVDKKNYKKTTLKTGEIINAGEPVYKLITSENWHLVAPITKEESKRLEEKESITINISNSSKNVTCNFELKQQDGKDFAIISLNQQMVNYINERFIDITIFMEQNNGLKIPNTSIIQKEVYKIPVDYLSYGSNSTQKEYFNIKVLDKKGEITTKQIKTDIYIQDKKYCYVDPNDFSDNDVLIKSNENETLPLFEADTAKIDGVYCVNQGIAAFRYIDVLFQDDEYTIIQADVPYSISWYDRIVLNPTGITENQIIK